MTKETLSSIFRSLGATDPEQWAESEINEGIPQLARFLFLKGCWDRIVRDGDTSWIDNVLKNVHETSEESFAGGTHAIRRIIADGASKEDISELVRNTQAEFLFEICYLLGDSRGVDGNDNYAEWALMTLDEDGNPEREIGGLHESVLGTDPTGREMTPASST